MSFSTRTFLLLVLVNVCRAGWFFGPSAPPSAEECIETAVVAAKKGDLKGIQSCLDVGWDVNAKDQYGQTALHKAAYNGKVDVIAALIKAGADVNAKSNDDDTALHLAAQKGKVDAIAALSKAGADINAKNNVGDTFFQDGMNDIAHGEGGSIAQLFKASVWSGICFFRYVFVSLFMDSNIDWGRTALHTAAYHGKVDSIAALIKAGADVNAKEENGYTALHQAASTGDKDAIAALIRAGADVNAKTPSFLYFFGRKTAFDLAKSRKHIFLFFINSDFTDAIQLLSKHEL